MTMTQLNHLYWAHERNEFRADIRIASLQALIANVNGCAKGRRKPYEALDFVTVPKPDRASVRKQRLAAAAEKFKSITASLPSKQNGIKE